jgi:L-amino acid N-acyltransferase YncA
MNPNANDAHRAQEPALAKTINVDEILALDLLTLREHTELAGDVFNAESQRQLLEQTVGTAEVVSVRRDGDLIAYAMLRPQEGERWFVLGFNTHPEHRNATVFRELFAQIANLAQRCSISSLQSNVYRTNRLSMAFHRRLGFTVTRETSKGVEFTASLQDLEVASPALQRQRLRSS